MPCWYAFDAICLNNAHSNCIKIIQIFSFSSSEIYFFPLRSLFYSFHRKLEIRIYSQNLCPFFYLIQFSICVVIRFFHERCSADFRLIWQGAAPCGLFQRLRCALRPFSTLYMCPTALSDTLYMCLAAHSVCVSTSICVCVSVSHLKGF